MDRATTAALALVTVVVLAGCTTPFVPSDGTGTGTPAPTAATERPTDATTGTTDPPGTRDPAARPSANPWGTETIVVAVRNEGGRERAFAPLVREATEFWAANDDRYLGFPVTYEVRPDADDPDIVVTFTDDVPDCGEVSDAAGCAPLITDPRAIDRPETVWVETGLSDDSTTLVTKHELGHTLGLTHDDGPRSVMRAASVLYTEPRRNATERSFPWADGAFTVRVDAADAEDPDGARRQVDNALGYYADGAPGMPSNLTFADAGADADAEVRVRFGRTAACDAQGSCVETYGTDPDGDGAIETYERVVITLVGIDTDAVGWHVGYWLAYAFGAEPDAEKPPPFREASPRERRSAWWE
jgi:hypothetical protein